MSAAPPAAIVAPSSGSGSRFEGRKRGGQPGNTNAVKHPAEVFWNRVALRPEDEWVRNLVRGYAPALLRDRGGDVSAAEGYVIGIAQRAHTSGLLALKERDLEGVARFASLELAALRALGLERRAKPVMSASQWVKDAAPIAPSDAINANSTLSEERNTNE